MIDGGEAGRRALLRTEARIAVIVNAVLSIVFFLLVFGWRDAAARDLAVDFLPQTFGVTFLGTLIPSLITYRRIARGIVAPAGPVPSRGRQVRRILLCALAAMAVLGGSAAVLLVALAPTAVPPLAGLSIKTAYGALVGIVVTPPIIRAVLGMPFLPGRTVMPVGAR